MKKVLVKKAISAQYPVGAGAPVMVLGGGGGGNSRGRTLREQAGGIAGGLVGVAGALTGNHRSLGSLVQSAISGGAQGKQLGSALGRKFVGRRGQEIANLREAQKRENAKLAAAHKEEFGASGFRDKPIADQRRTYLRGVAVRQAEDKQRAKEEQMAGEAHARAYGGQQGAEDKVDAETMRNLRQRFGGGLDPFEASSRVDAMNEAFNSRPTPEPADFEPTDGSYPVTVVDPMANSPIAQGAPPLPPASNEGSALAEINDAEQAGEKMMAETGMDQTDRLTEAELPQAPPTPEVEASELSDAQKRAIEESLNRKKKVRVKPPEE